MDESIYILIVDDNELDQYVAQHYLKKAWPDADFAVVGNGLEAIAHLETHPDRLPDLVFLDINMPRMDGHEFLEAWYTETQQKVPIVVMLTSADQNEDRERAGEHQSVVGYIVKPLGKRNLSWLREVAARNGEGSVARPSAQADQALRNEDGAQAQQ